MTCRSPQRIRRWLGALSCLLAWTLLALPATATTFPAVALADPQTPSPASLANSSANSSQQPSASAKLSQQSRESGVPVRIPRQQALTTSALDGIVRDAGFSNLTIPVPGARLTLRDLQTGQILNRNTSGEG